MDIRSYITEDEVKKFLNYLKIKNKYNYYIIIYNLVYGNKSYKELQSCQVEDLLIPDEIPIPEKNPFLINITGVNTNLKTHQALCGIRGVNFSTRLFKQKFIMDGKLYCGSLKKSKNKNVIYKEGYLYIMKNTHINPKICKILKDKKIGITTDLNRRLKSLTLGPVGVDVIKLWKTNYSNVKLMEKKIHSVLNERNTIGEWFSDENEDLIKIVENILKTSDVVVESINPKI